MVLIATYRRIKRLKRLLFFQRFKTELSLAMLNYMLISLQSLHTAQEAHKEPLADAI